MIIAYEENGISKQRPATEEEEALILAAQNDAQNAKATEEAEKAALIAKKEEVLNKLNLTDEEVKALLS